MKCRDLSGFVGCGGRENSAKRQAKGEMARAVGDGSAIHLSKNTHRYAESGRANGGKRT